MTRPIRSSRTRRTHIGRWRPSAAVRPDRRAPLTRFSTMRRDFALAPRRNGRVADERIARPFAAERAGRAVSRNESHLVAEWPELAGDRLDQVLVIAHREVGPSDRAGEEDVADEGEPGRAMEERHVSWRVPRAVEHFEPVLA